MSYPVGPRLVALANRILRNLDLIEAKATPNLTIGLDWWADETAGRAGALTPTARPRPAGSCIGPGSGRCGLCGDTARCFGLCGIRRQRLVGDEVLISLDGQA